MLPLTACTTVLLLRLLQCCFFYCTAHVQEWARCSTPDLCSCPAVCLPCVRYAATKGDTVKLRAMLQQGFNPDSADYGAFPVPEHQEQTTVPNSELAGSPCSRSTSDCFPRAECHTSSRNGVWSRALRVGHTVPAAPAAADRCHTLPALLLTDGRTALMLACVRGHRDVVSLLLAAGMYEGRQCVPASNSVGSAARTCVCMLAYCGRPLPNAVTAKQVTRATSLTPHYNARHTACSPAGQVALHAPPPPASPAGANPRLDDNVGRSALLEACYHGHDAIIDTLKTAGASLAITHLGWDANSSSSGSSAGRLTTSGSSSSNISGVRASSSSSSDRKARVGATGDLAAAGGFGSLSVASGSSGSSEEDGREMSHTGASWALQLASLLCNCVYECNLPVRLSHAPQQQVVAAALHTTV